MNDPEITSIESKGTEPEPIAAQTHSQLWIDTTAKMIQVVCVVIGVVISVMSFNKSRDSESDARLSEAATRRLELQKIKNDRDDEAYRRKKDAAKPFLELRQKLYLEAVHSAGVLATPNDHTPDEVKRARIRFRELYVAELCLVESDGVSSGMFELAHHVDPDIQNMNEAQHAALALSRTLGHSLVNSWNLSEGLPGSNSK